MKKISLLSFFVIVFLTGCSNFKTTELQIVTENQPETKQVDKIIIDKNDHSDTYIEFIEWYDKLSTQEKRNVDDELEEMRNKNYEYKEEERLEISY